MSRTSEVTVIPPAETSDRDLAFDRLVQGAGERVRRALVARYGVEIGNDVCADALAYAWEHRDTLLGMENPAGYLYRVGQSAARRHHRWRRVPDLPPEEPTLPADPDPGLHLALRRLSRDQRVAVVLVHGYGWSYQEAAEVLDVPVSTVRNHLHRGLKRLRAALEASDGA